MSASEPIGRRTVVVKTHRDLRSITEEEFQRTSERVLRDADRGIQTAIIGPDGKTVKTIIGMNGHRFLRDPDPDPLAEIQVREPGE